MQTYIVELNGYDTTNLVEKTLYWSSASFKAFATGDSDRPDQYYQPRLNDVGVINRRMFAQGRTFGASNVNGGVITVSNADNGLDYLLDWGFDGREVRVLLGDVGSAWSTFTEIMKGTVKQPVFTFSKKSASEIEFIIRDRRQELEIPIQDNLYLGTNSGSTGDEGLEQDIQDKPKPLSFGQCSNVTAIPSNTSALRFQVHDGEINDVNACYDNGISLTKVASPPGASQYSVNTTTGIIEVGSNPSGTITCDVKGAAPSASYKTTVADIVEHILLTYGGIVAGDINSTALSDLNTANSSVVGLYVSSNTNITNVLDSLCNSIGAYWFFDRLGVFQIGRFEAPATSIDTFTDNELIELDRIQSGDDDKGIPSYRVEIEYDKNFTIQSGDSLAGAVTDLRRAYLELGTRSITDDDTSVQTAHLLSPVINRQSLMVVAANATTEAARVLTLYKTRRDFYKVVLPNEVIVTLLELGNTITIKFNKFGLDAGKDFVIVAISDQSPEVNQTEIEVWG